MVYRSTTIFTCNRCKCEEERGHSSHPSELWFKIHEFEVGKTQRNGVKEVVELCEGCGKQLHEWWNKGESLNPDSPPT